MDLRLGGKTAIVTGASRGIGRAVAVALAGEGVDVALCARSAEGLGAVAEAVRGLGRRALVVPADLTRPEAAPAVVERVVAEWGRVDVLVNNAGASRFGDPLRLDDAAFVEAMDLKYLGYVRMARAVTPEMVRQGGGAIVNIIGTGGVQPGPAHLPGSAANAALILFTKGFGRELARHNVRVNAVSPAGVATERLRTLMEAMAEREGISVEEATRRSSVRLPIGRPARPEEVADAVLFLASERAGYFVGANLIMDGGEVAAV